MIKIKKPSKISLIVFVAAAIIAAGLIIYFFQNQDETRTNSSDSPQSTGQEADTVNLQPPTKEDLQRADANKESVSNRIDQENKANQQPAQSNQAVSPVITFAEQYDSNIELGGYVNVFEDGGTCTATFTKGVNRVTRTNDAIKNVNSVNCPTFSIPVSEFAEKGSWTVTLTYSSPTASGPSAAKQVEVR